VRAVRTAPDRRTVQGRNLAAVSPQSCRRPQLEAAHLEAGMIRVEVESVLSAEGEPEVELLVDQGHRWFRSRPVYLSRSEARQLAYELLEAAGFHYAAVLD